MDIYSFLNSSDIAAHCREINHTWNPFDMAVIIGISYRPMDEKHTAWRELMADYPDMPTPRGLHHESYPSLHEKLEEAIAYEMLYRTQSQAIFKQAEQGAVYVYAIDEYNREKSVFTNLESLFADVYKNFEREEVQSIRVIKSNLDDGDNDKGTITARLDYDGNIADVDVSASEDLRAKWFPNVNYDSSRMFSDDFYVIIPTPFKRGDILTHNNTPWQLGEKSVFVLDNIGHDNPKTLERRLRYDGDITDMCGRRYFVYDDGTLCEDNELCYDRLEYYRGKLEGKDRLLQYVSWYLKDVIALTPLMLMQCRVVSQQQLNASFDLIGWAYPKEHIIADGQADHINETDSEASSDTRNIGGAFI